MENDTKTFVPGKVRATCNECQDIIWSRHEGEYTTCKCGASSIDTTRWYSRYIGACMVRADEYWKDVDAG